MTILSAVEIKPGLVIYLEESVLRNSRTVVWSSGKGSKHGPAERRPFLCTSVSEGECCWTPVTTEPKSGSGYKRLQLEARWKSGGDENCYDNQWIKRNTYLVDGANSYSGPIDEFISASANECTTTETRALLSEDGVVAVVAEMKKQERRRVLVNE